MSESQMPPEENKVIVQRYWDEVVNQGNLDVADEIFTSDWVLHQSSWTGGDWTRDVLKTIVAKFRAVYPDLQAHLNEQATVEGDRVLTRYTVTGTRVDTEAHVEVEGISISRISDGRISESWVNWDAFGLVQQEVPDPGGPRFGWPLPCWWCK